MNKMILVTVGMWLVSTVAVAASAPPPAPVTTVEIANRSLLANNAGMTLYVFDVDVPPNSSCYDACATFWHATIVQASDNVAAPFGRSTRKDGTVQLTLNNRPLYTYAGDHKSGDDNGDGVNGKWHVVPF